MPACHSAFDQWAALYVELGVGSSQSPTTVGVWGSSHWGNAADARWSGLEPQWGDVSGRVMDVAITRGRVRWTDRIGASTAQVTCDNADGWLTWNRTAVTAQQVRVGSPVRVWAMTPDGVHHDLWRGFLESVADDYKPYERPAATLSCEDALAQLGHVDLPEGPVVGASERTDQRIARVLDAADWPKQWRTLATGQVTVQGTNLARNLADEAGITADSEGGAVYAGVNGNVVFQNRDWLRLADYAQNVQAVIGPGGAVCGSEHRVTIDGGDILNDVQMGRAGGTALRVVNQDSIARYRRRTYQRTDLVCETDAQVQLLAQRLLDARSPASVRLTDVTVPVVDQASATFVCTVAYGWRLHVTWSDPDSTETWTREVLVMGMTHRITPGGWELTLAVDDATLLAAASAWGSGKWGTAKWTEAS